MIARRYNAPVLGYVTPHKAPVAEVFFERNVGRPAKAELKAQIRAMRRGGAKLRVIADKFGITAQYVAKICAGGVHG